MKIFAERMKLLRKEKKKTQSEMAEFLGIKLRAYQYYEAGIRRPEYQHLLDLADFFDVSLDYLTGRSETRTRQP